MPDDIIGAVTGTATFQHVTIERGDPGFVNVTGHYHDSTTTYQAPESEVYVGGLSIDTLDGPFSLSHPDSDGYVWVEATEKELQITMEKPEQ